MGVEVHAQETELDEETSIESSEAEVGSTQENVELNAEQGHEAEDLTDPQSLRVTDAERVQQDVGEQEEQTEETLQEKRARGSNPTGVTPQALALPEGTGSIQGMGESFTPDLNTGSGSFSLPIALPPGRRGLAPSV